MRANNFIRAVVSASFGAAVYLALTLNGSSEASDQLQHKVETHKVVVMARAPSAVRTVQKTSEKFVAVAPVASIPPIKKVEDLAAERERKLEVEAKATALRAKIIAQKAKEEAVKKAKVAAEKAKKIKAEKERKEKLEKARKAKEEKERKEREAAAAKRAREALRGVPVSGGHIGASFGQTGLWARYHTGLDFSGVAYGSSVRAVANGRIIYAGNSGNWAGNYVVIRHADGKKTLYAHMSSISRHGGRVRMGDKIGRVGSSGRAFGTHLHLELYPAGAQPGDVYSAINPRPWLRGLGVRLG